MGELLTTGELLRRTTRYFGEKGLPSPRLDAEVLLAWALGCERVDLYVNYDRPLEPDEVARYRELVGRRAKRVPVAFLRGFKEFYALPFTVSPAVLIPRPETETLVQVVLEWLAGKGERAEGTVADVGTGSGCLAVTVAKHIPGVRVIATDCSPDALAVAQANAERHGVADRVSFLAGDGPEPLLAAGWAGRLDAVLANPPYIPTPVLAELAQDIAYEPRVALDGGPDGLAFYRRWLDPFAALLRPGGLLAVEIGHDQGPAVTALAGETGAFTEVTVIQDHGGRDRVVRAFRRNGS